MGIAVPMEVADSVKFNALRRLEDGLMRDPIDSASLEELLTIHRRFDNCLYESEVHRTVWRVIRAKRRRENELQRFEREMKSNGVEGRKTPKLRGVAHRMAHRWRGYSPSNRKIHKDDEAEGLRRDRERNAA